MPSDAGEMDDEEFAATYGKVQMSREKFEKIEWDIMSQISDYEKVDRALRILYRNVTKVDD